MMNKVIINIKFLVYCKKIIKEKMQSKLIFSYIRLFAFPLQSLVQLDSFFVY
jgi:hypothetical protein